MPASEQVTGSAAFGGPNAGLPLDADGKWHGVIDDPDLATVCGYRPRWAALAPSQMFRCSKPKDHGGYHGEWT